MRRFLTAILLFVASAATQAAPPLLLPAAFNDGTAVDSEPLGTRVPLVLIHGLGGSGQGWENFYQVYARTPAWRAAFKPYSFRYTTTITDTLLDPSTPSTVPGLGRSLRDAVQYYLDKPNAAPDNGFGGRSIVILAHSLGGLVARSMMQEYSFRDGTRGGERVLHLITLGTPHQGTPLADVAAEYGITMADEILGSQLGLVRSMVWTNFDNLDLGSQVCNPWLAQLNSYNEALDAYQFYGKCGAMRTVRKRGFYERIIAYGARNLQPRDPQVGTGVFRPGSDPALNISYTYLREFLPRSYANDGLVPLTSAQFDGQPVWARKEVFGCDHRYIERGYVEVVRASAELGYVDTNFCGATAAGPLPSGVQGGFGTVNTIFGAPDGIGAAIVNASQAERVFRWAESNYPQLLVPAGVLTDVVDRGLQRSYPASRAVVQIKDGSVFYTGPESGQVTIRMGSLAQYLLIARNAGF